MVQAVDTQPSTTEVIRAIAPSDEVRELAGASMKAGLVKPSSTGGTYAAPFETLNWDSTSELLPVVEDDEWRKQLSRFVARWLEQIAPTGGARVDVTDDRFASGTAHLTNFELTPPPEHIPAVRDPKAYYQPYQSSITAITSRASILAAKKRRYQRHRTQSHERAKKGGEEKDLPACQEIYEHYVKTSVVVPELEGMTKSMLQSILEGLNTVKLPFLVAVEGFPPVLPTSAREGKVVGFAFADDFGDPRNCYRYTVELQLYVHPQFRRLGVGTRLLDQMVSILDRSYVHRGGYTFCDGEGWGPGGRRQIVKVVCNIPYTVDDSIEMARVKKWLERFGFDQMADLPRMGIKFGKWVNVLQLQRTTKENVDHLL
ncbi:MAG: hypothetical protein M1838_004974 [Thelocarpon superellum]|nr:MAG: hypothetical protein M1838_004974 [Thelocarpon superellum]